MLQISTLKEHSFLVYGLGVTGLSVVKFFKKNKIKNFKVWDDRKKRLLLDHRSKNLKQTLKNVDYIVLAPGISLRRNKHLAKYKKKILTDIDLFYLKNKEVKSVVVTGTNGKSTTCKLLSHLLKKSKFNCHLGGNIGHPILDLKISKKSYVIIEASSFQLSHSKLIQPTFAIFLNLSNDHLDWHKNMKDYFNSKLKIFELQNKSQYAIISEKYKKIFKARKFLSKPIFPSKKNYFKIKKKIQNSYLTSNTNDENMSFVYSFSKLLKIKENFFIDSMKSFKGLPHRYEIFLKKNNFTFINDSKATSFKATQSALSGLKNIYLILGGLPKKKDKINLSNYKKKIIKCYLIGKNINFFKKQIEHTISFDVTKNLKNSILQIFKDSSQNKNEKKYVLLSPAAASFDQFSNFQERGNEFKRLCKLYAGKFI